MVEKTRSSIDFLRKSVGKVETIRFFEQVNGFILPLSVVHEFNELFNEEFDREVDIESIDIIRHEENGKFCFRIISNEEIGVVYLI